MRITSFLWVLPFFCFLSGYQLIRLFADHSTLEAPSVVGSNINDAIKLLSTYHLNARILSEKEESDFPEGIVISQSPPHGQKIKSHQSIFLTVTRKPPKPVAVPLYGLSKEEASAMAQKKGIPLQLYGVESISPKGGCIAQNTQPQEEINEGCIAYYSDGITPIRIFPKLIGLPLDVVTKFLRDYGIEVNVAHTQMDKDHTCNSCTVVAQKPLEGTLVNLKKPLAVALTVQA